MGDLSVEFVPFRKFATKELFAQGWAQRLFDERIGGEFPQRLAQRAWEEIFVWQPVLLALLPGIDAFPLRHAGVEIFSNAFQTSLQRKGCR